MGMNRLLFILPLLVSTLAAQTTLYVAGPNTGLGVAWRGITYTASPGNTVYQSDPLGDRQTGQPVDDFINVPNNPGFFMALGFVNNVPSIGFRIYLSEYSTAGYSGNFRVGLDANGDGQLDVFVGPKLSGAARAQGIIFQDATGPGNYSPSTTALSNPYSSIAFTTDNYNYQTLNTTLDPTWSNVGPNPNAILSFSVPVQTLKDNLAGIGINLTDQAYFNVLAFTSTQANAINQDLFGSTGISNGTRFDGLDGGFADYYALDGSYKTRPIIPEPTTYGAIFVAFMLGVIMWKRKR